jgi:hypothetical protein
MHGHSSEYIASKRKIFELDLRWEQYTNRSSALIEIFFEENDWLSGMIRCSSFKKWVKFFFQSTKPKAFTAFRKIYEDSEFDYTYFGGKRSVNAQTIEACARDLKSQGCEFSMTKYWKENDDVFKQDQESPSGRAQTKKKRRSSPNIQHKRQQEVSVTKPQAEVLDPEKSEKDLEKKASKHASRVESKANDKLQENMLKEQVEPIQILEEEVIKVEDQSEQLHGQQRVLADLSKKDRQRNLTNRKQAEAYAMLRLRRAGKETDPILLSPDKDLPKKFIPSKQTLNLYSENEAFLGKEYGQYMFSETRNLRSGKQVKFL